MYQLSVACGTWSGTLSTVWPTQCGAAGEEQGETSMIDSITAVKNLFRTPKVRCVLLDDKKTYACLLHTANGGDIEYVALGGGPTISEAKANSMRFAEALISAIERS